MLVTLCGIVTLVSLVQPANALAPMLVTLLGIVTLVSPLQLWNALSPMLVTLVGIVTLVRLAATQERTDPRCWSRWWESSRWSSSLQP